MTKDQEDILSMYQTVDQVMQDNGAIWAANLPLGTAVEQLEVGIHDIENLRDQQDTNSTGITQDKEQARELLTLQSSNIAAMIRFYAATISNNKLLKSMYFTDTDFMRARDNEIVGFAEQILEAATANAADLLAFGYTSGMGTALQDKIDAYTALISQPRAAISESSSATEQLPQVFNRVNDLLKDQMDNGMQLYRVAHIDFYLQYFNAREIVNSPTNKRALEITYKDSTSLEPIANIKVNIDGGSIERRSSNLGNIRVQNLTEGSHEALASKPGYQDALSPFTVTSGETTTMTVMMNKL